MIDFTKILIPSIHSDSLLRHDLLSFARNVNEDTGEIRESEERTAEFQNMKFKIYPSGRIILQGSWHKYSMVGIIQTSTFLVFVQPLFNFVKRSR